MQTLILPDNKLAEVMAALEHASASEHHRHCSIRKTMHCSCHVEKARTARQHLVQAARCHPVPASELKVGQWLTFETAPAQRIVQVGKGAGILPKVAVTVDNGIDGAKPETLTFQPSDQVFVSEPAA